MDSIDAKFHHCTICHRKYKRAEHLRRHLICHGDKYTRLACKSCGHNFSRSDALTRHLKTCVAVNGQPVPSRRRACDRCAQSKKACDFQSPCRACLERKFTCTHSPLSFFEDAPDEDQVKFCDTSGLQERPLSEEPFKYSSWEIMHSDLLDLANTSWDEFLSLQSPSTDSSSTGNKRTLPFLDNFTRHTGLVKSFDCMTLEMRQMALHRANEMSTTLSSNVSNDSLLNTCAAIVALIEEVIIIKPRNSAVDVTWSESVQQACLRFFDASNVYKNVELYWSVWHPNVNIVHHATFDLTLASPVLIAAMAVMGASVSPSIEDWDKARLWFNAVEEAVFVSDDFCDDSIVFPGHTPSLAKIQALQAAYIVCLYQNWEGTDQSKRRIRRHRFSTLVSVARDIGIQNAKHIPQPSTSYFDWHDFAAREQLIRVFLWIFLLDTAFVIFNNLPPRMVIKEMNMSLACCEAIFQASSSDNALEILRRESFREGTESFEDSLSLDQATAVLCSNELDTQTITKLAHLGPLNLFVMTSSLHSMLFQYQNSFIFEGQLVPLRNALDSLKAVWSLYLQKYAHSAEHAPIASEVLTSDNMWRRIGFVKHASEYWLLASLLLDRMCIAERHSLVEIDQPSSSKSHFTSPQEQILHAVLHRYDETSMQQVNDLIADFQRTSLSS